jgi:uncharacterized protein
MKGPIILYSMFFVRNLFCSFVLPLTILGFSNQAKSSEEVSTIFKTSELTIVTADRRYHFWVEVAQSAAQRQQGLMGRHEMLADRGMLLDFGSLQLVRMWMKNTYIPLDMIFLGEAGSINAIEANTTPFSKDVISSPNPARAVLELNGGTVSRLKIKVGDKVFHRIFQP